jgi:hypothetical protein
MIIGMHLVIIMTDISLLFAVTATVFSDGSPMSDTITETVP